MEADARLCYVRWPIEDGPLPDLATISAIDRFAATFIEDGGAVVVMCNMGLNRSGLLTTLIISRLQHIGGAEALRYVRSKIPDAVRNPAFAAYIERALTPFRRRPTQQRPASLAAPSKL